MPANGSISGRVVDGSGAPVAGAAVSLTASPGPHRDIAAITSADGRFHFRGLPPGAYRVTAHVRDQKASANAVVGAGLETAVELGFHG